jgi:hypothetical protein
MRKPLAKRRYQRSPMTVDRRYLKTSREQSVPPPVGGWNRRDSLRSMRATDAVKLENWFPLQSECITRPGFSQHSDTEESSIVAQLIPFEYAANSKLLACTSGKIIDVTTDTPSDLETSLTGNYWSYDYIGGYVIMANGADVVKSYEGTTVADPAFTGVTLTNLNHVHSYKSRLYFVQKNTQSMWYGGVGAVAGTLTEFDFSSVAPIKGNLILTTHSKGDGGDGGVDDLFVAVFADGDVLVYAGSNPGDAADWALKGHYKIGRPLSRFSCANLADDIYIITDRGYEKLKELLQLGDVTPERLLLSSKIQQEVAEAVTDVGEDEDWRIISYVRGQMLIITVPDAGGSRRYHVQNINTQAWCEFKGFLAYSWATLGGNIYFGGTNGVVYQFDDGSANDNGTAIRVDAQQAWQSFGYPGRNKTASLVNPTFETSLLPAISINLGQNYEPISLSPAEPVDNPPSGGVWGVGVWGEAEWGTGPTLRDRWYSRNAIGHQIGMRMVMNVSSARVRWSDTNYIYQLGGPI